MRTEIVTCAQRSPEWYAARAGRLTGSRACDALAFSKRNGEELAARRDYRLQLAVERLTSLPLEDGFVSKDMQRGIDMEPLARAAYEARTGRIVRTTGFIKSLDLMAGASLDGDCGDFKRLVSFKCPKSSTHVGYWQEGKLPEDYREQARHEMWLLPQAETYDFVSWDDRLPLELHLFMVSVRRDQLDIPGYEKYALAFLAEVELEVAELQELRQQAVKKAA